MSDYTWFAWDSESVVLNTPIDDETNLTQRTYFIERVYNDGTGYRTCEAHWYDASGRVHQVQNWMRLHQLAQVMDARVTLAQVSVPC